MQSVSQFIRCSDLPWQLVLIVPFQSTLWCKYNIVDVVSDWRKPESEVPDYKDVF